MITISARDFRESQGKYLKQALNGSELVLSTRDYGSFRITPITEDDRVYNDEELDRMIRSAIDEYKAGKAIRYTVEELREMAGL